MRSRLVYPLVILAPVIATVGAIAYRGPIVWAFIGTAFAIDLVAAGIWAAGRRDET